MFDQVTAFTRRSPPFGQIALDPSSTVEILKNAIAEKEDYSPESQMLIYAGLSFLVPRKVSSDALQAKSSTIGRHSKTTTSANIPTSLFL